jgi:hypothetical protein
VLTSALSFQNRRMEEDDMERLDLRLDEIGAPLTRRAAAS